MLSSRVVGDPRDSPRNISTGEAALHVDKPLQEASLSLVNLSQLAA